MGWLRNRQSLRDYVKVVEQQAAEYQDKYLEQRSRAVRAEAELDKWEQAYRELWMQHVMQTRTRAQWMAYWSSVPDQARDTR